MSKVSSNYPAYSSSKISVGDSNATTGVNNGILTSAYNMSDDEAAIYNYALSTLASILPGINTFDTDTKSSIQSQVKAYQDQGLDKINEIYNPMIQNLTNDISSRFGNLDNSIFKDDLGDIESERSNAVSSFAQNVLSKQSELESDELTKRYSLIQMLNGLANNTYDKALDAINTALGGSSSLNNYNSDIYDAINALQSTNSKATTNNVNSMLSSLFGLTNGANSNSTISSLFSSFL